MAGLGDLILQMRLIEETALASCLSFEVIFLIWFVACRLVAVGGSILVLF